MLALNKLITDKRGQISTFPFPPNIAATLPKSMRQRILRWMLQKYIWPQYTERLVFEQEWQELRQMARAVLKVSDMRMSEKSRLAVSMRDKQIEGIADPDGNSDVADTVIFDAIDRLVNLSQFIAYKEEVPVQFQLPKYVRRPTENAVYGPSKDLVDGGNALLKYNADVADMYGNDMLIKRHYYTYGMCVVNSEFKWRIDVVPRLIDTPQGKVWEDTLELGEIGATYEGISIRKLWLNQDLPLNKMELQPCPFFFEAVPRFAIIANPYNPQTSPFGYDNLNSIPPGQGLATATEAQDWYNAMNNGKESHATISVIEPKFGAELNWMLYPMLPLVEKPLNPQVDPTTGDPVGEVDPGINEYYRSLTYEELQALQSSPNPPQTYWDFDDSGDKNYPMTRFVMEAFGGSLIAGSVEITKLQKNFYPRNNLPIYGASHMADLDSGAYGTSIGSILRNHYIQLCKAFNQYLDNKDTLNDPPAKVQANSPAMTKDLNKRGAKIPVNSINDYMQHPIVDATGTTPAFIQMVRDQAQTSSKAVDAILGKAMGSRTSATEASNIFQTAMSGVTTDINLYTRDTAGVFAYRMWDYWGLWVDEDILKAITGQFGFTLKPEDFQVKLGLNWAIGSHFIESITRVNNYRYILETSRGDPSINSAYLWREILGEWKIGNIDRIVNDGGFETEVVSLTDQTQRTYIGEDIPVDPDSNHGIAIKLITSFLKDTHSVWNTRPEFALNMPKVLQRLQIHQQFQLLQMQQQQALAASQDPNNPNAPTDPNSPSGPTIETGMSGSAAQQQGGILA